MRVLSKAFGRLKTTLPWVPADTKLSKLDTLRLATTYIAHLSSLLATTAPERQLMADRSASTTATAATTGTGPQPQNCNAVMVGKPQRAIPVSLLLFSGANRFSG